MIRTILGDISPEKLGWCQCHEHLFVADGPSRKVSQALYMDDYSKSLAELKLYRQGGGASLVDAQPYGCGRMAGELVRASRESGVNIVAVTGFHKTEFIEDGILDKGGDALTRIYIDEVSQGMEGLSARAGLVKFAAVPGEMDASPAYAMLFDAAVHAAAETGLRVLVHTDTGADPMRLLDYFSRFGIAPSRVIICHMDRSCADVKIHEAVAEAGAYLEYDTIHRLKYKSDEDELDLIAHMAERGFTNRLLVGMDTTNERLKSYGAAFGLDFILKTFRYRLAERIGQAALEAITIANPAVALSIV
jgi:predicted metal-dependent phosphotriesterase family hydrolase